MRPSIPLALAVPFALAACPTSSKPVPPAAAEHPEPVQMPYDPGPARTRAEREARTLLETLVPLLQPAFTTSANAAWIAATDVTPEHTAERAGAEKVAAALSGSRLIIEKTRALLAEGDRIDEITRRQLQKLLLGAAENPATIPDVVSRRVETEARQSSILDGYTFCLDSPGKGACKKPITANEIDKTLLHSRNLDERQLVWTASKAIGAPLKPGLRELQTLRNKVARELGHASFFALQVADYGMTVDEMMKLLDDTLTTTRPLFQELHCWAKNRLATQFGKPAPRRIPAHWIGNRWAQNWPGLVEGADMDVLFKKKTAEDIVKAAETFYLSLGFQKLPDSFWKKSDLYPVAAGQPRKKNTHASAWHIDGELDVRSLMSVEPNSQWFGTAHHELGHIYYYLSYTRPEVPYILRGGANRAFHEAIGELAKLASEQLPYLRKVGLLQANEGPKPEDWLLDSGLDSIAFLPWSAGVMSHFERDLYEQELPETEWQSRWWKYVGEMQGVEPPNARPAELCDACTKTHINDDAAQYYDYALATLIKFQLHDHICSKILKQDVRACDYSGHPEVGDFLRTILAAGATKDWRKLMRDSTGEDIGPRAMQAFYQPLRPMLEKLNQGRDCSF